MQYQYHVSDMALKEILPSFISDFEIYPKTQKHLKHNSAKKYVCAIMMLMHRAHQNGWVMQYPFGDYQIREEETEKGFLTKDELQAMMNLPRLNAKRTFIRACSSSAHSQVWHTLTWRIFAKRTLSRTLWMVVCGFTPTVRRQV